MSKKPRRQKQTAIREQQIGNVRYIHQGGVGDHQNLAREIAISNTSEQIREDIKNKKEEAKQEGKDLVLTLTPLEGDDIEREAYQGVLESIKVEDIKIVETEFVVQQFYKVTGDPSA